MMLAALLLLAEKVGEIAAQGGRIAAVAQFRAAAASRTRSIRFLTRRAVSGF